MRHVGSVICTSIITLTAALSCGRVETIVPQPTNVYSSKPLGISFVIPKGLNLYTAQNPGPFRSQISEQVPLILTNPDFPAESVNLVVIVNKSESDVVEYEKSLQQAQTMPVPEYKRVFVATIRLGKDRNKLAVEHVFFMKRDITGKLRAITFSHNGKGFIFTCGTAPERFDNANKMFFQPFFDSMTFE
jgi:hypothetical protein